MGRAENEQRIKDQFKDSRERAIKLASPFVADAESVVDEATEIFARCGRCHRWPISRLSFR